ncbi:hypothetical protein ZIOFF_035603 [Zingiber officinale]|uniref:Enhancer of rudimentary homolog n=1 Tax=Zingiber officinale TaxID=94328 RepID=A0A8J5L2S7_ZINOF|nr:hypothetical protein ZIOFF_035603 [Zingiber officinale]
MQANRHTIILMQSSPNRATRTFMDYDSISQAMDGICGLYERKLKEINPTVQNITYDISDLYNFIDGLADLSALMFASFTVLPLAISLLQLISCAFLVASSTRFRLISHMTGFGSRIGCFIT